MNGDILSVGSRLPRLQHAEAREGRTVRIIWENGESRTVDLLPALLSRRVYIPLRTDDALFQSLQVSETRNAIEWPGGLDFSAVWLDRLPDADFGNDTFCQAMDELGFTLDGMAAALDVSRRLVAEYRKDKPIPKHIGYATRFLLSTRRAS